MTRRRKNKLPRLYAKLLEFFDGRKLRRKELFDTVPKRFRITKEDLAAILKELEDLGLVKRRRRYIYIKLRNINL